MFRRLLIAYGIPTLCFAALCLVTGCRNAAIERAARQEERQAIPEARKDTERRNTWRGREAEFKRKCLDRTDWLHLVRWASTWDEATEILKQHERTWAEITGVPYMPYALD